MRQTDNPPAGPRPAPGPREAASRVARTTRLVLIGGLAAGVGFATVTGIAAAAGTGAHSGTLTSAKSPARPKGGRPGPGWPGPPGHRGLLGIRGDEGTITSMSTQGDGYLLTLRTLAGSEEVLTTSSTTVLGADLEPTSLSSSDVGLVVRVRSSEPGPRYRPGSSSGGVGRTADASQSREIDATRVRFVDPTVLGRVTSVGTDSYTLVGSNGQEIAVTTTPGSTRYLTGYAKGSPETTTTAPSYAVGDVLFASGTETTAGAQSATAATTSISAVLVGRAPARRAGRGPLHGMPVPPIPGRGPGGSGTSAA